MRRPSVRATMMALVVSAAATTATVGMASTASATALSHFTTIVPSVEACTGEGWNLVNQGAAVGFTCTPTGDGWWVMDAWDQNG
jgi:hypothetical protein